MNIKWSLPLVNDNNQGLTLLELLVALSIIAVLALVSIPLFIDFIKEYRLSAAANSLYFNLQLARTEAVKRNANVYVSFTTGDTWCLGIGTSACNCAIANNCNIASESYTSSQQLSLSVSGYASNTIIFEPTHGAANSSGSVTFTIYGQSSPLITTSISRLGALTVCSTGMSGYTAC
jgi:prepilin-type N-terminal cleavage/methylation domain-containing protein